MRLFHRSVSSLAIICGVALASTCVLADNQLNSEETSVTVTHIQTAAKNGDADAQYALGYMYFYGQQLPKDMERAKYWMHKAAAQGQARAKTALQMLGESVTTPQPEKKIQTAAATSTPPQLAQVQTPKQAPVQTTIAQAQPKPKPQINSAAPIAPTQIAAKATSPLQPVQTKPIADTTSARVIAAPKLATQAKPVAAVANTQASSTSIAQTQTPEQPQISQTAGKPVVAAATSTGTVTQAAKTVSAKFNKRSAQPNQQASGLGSRGKHARKANYQRQNRQLSHQHYRGKQQMQQRKPGNTAQLRGNYAKAERQHYRPHDQQGNFRGKRNTQLTRGKYAHRRQHQGPRGLRSPQQQLKGARGTTQQLAHVTPNADSENVFKPPAFNNDAQPQKTAATKFPHRGNHTIARLNDETAHRMFKISNATAPAQIEKSKVAEAPANKATKLAKAAKPAITKPDHAANHLTKTERRLLAMPNEHYTLQLIGTRNKEQIDALIRENDLKTEARMYHTYYQNKDWYVLVYGDYRSPAQALAAIDQLPAKAQQLKPWVKPFSSVKVSIRAAMPRKHGVTHS